MEHRLDGAVFIQPNREYPLNQWLKGGILCGSVLKNSTNSLVVEVLGTNRLFWVMNCENTGTLKNIDGML